MSKSISFQHGTKLSREHNIRNAKYIKNQEHIDKGRTDQNIIFIDEKLQDVYEEIFGESFQEYNCKLRKDRQSKSYYDKIKDDSQKHLVYECVVQIGKEEDTGCSSELEQQALIQFFMEWKERNQHLKLVGAYMHNDEATSHLHLDYIPVATDCTRGMKTQNSLTKALQQQGFNGKGANNTEQMQWQNSERKALEKICRELGIDARANQGLCKTKYYDEKTGTVKIGTRRHLSTNEYKQARKEMLSDVAIERQQIQNKINKLNKEIKRKIDVLNVEKNEIPEMPETITVKGMFGKEKTRSLTEEERTLKQQEIDNIKKQNELVQLQNLLRERELTIQEQERKQKARLQKQNAELEQINNEIATAKAIKTDLQREIDDLQQRKPEIVANAVNNALENLDELNTYYATSQAFTQIRQEYFVASERINKESREIYGNKNVKHSNNFELQI